MTRPVASDEIMTGIGQTLPDTDSALPEMWYNLQGIPVAAPEPGGVYILRRGSSAAKVRF